MPQDDKNHTGSNNNRAKAEMALNRLGLTEN